MEVFRDGRHRKHRKFLWFIIINNYASDKNCDR